MRDLRVSLEVLCRPTFIVFFFPVDLNSSNIDESISSRASWIRRQVQPGICECLPWLHQDFKGMYTPNANMADHSVGARDESHESEASKALMFCFDNMLFQKSLASLSIWSLCFALSTRFCVTECHRKEVKSSTAEKVFFPSQLSRSSLTGN